MRKISINSLKRLRFTPGFTRGFSDAGHSGDFRTQLRAPQAISSEIQANVKGDTKNPWELVKDPSGSGNYYWNTATNETTPVNAPRPAHWVEVRSDISSGSLTYWWNPENNSTTALGAPKPHYTQITANPPLPGGSGTHAPLGTGGIMKTYFIVGIGVALGGILVRAVLG